MWFVSLQSAIPIDGFVEGSIADGCESVTMTPEWCYGPVGMASDHVMETPSLDPLESDVNEMNMLPDVALMISGTTLPLNSPKLVLCSESPS